MTVLASDRIPIDVEGRTYGRGLKLTPEERPPVAVALRDLAPALIEASALLKLAPESTLTKAQVFEAYRQDIALLDGHKREFEACMFQAVRCSLMGWELMRCQGLMSSPSPEEKIAAEWEKVKGQIPELGTLKLLPLPFDLAAQPAETVLQTLQREFHRGVERLLRRFNDWLHHLAELEYIGFIEWTAPDVCRYHYFRREATDTVLDTQERTETEFDPDRLYGEQHIATTTRDTLLRRDLHLERHVHHVVEAALHTLAAYPRMVPLRVSEFLNAVPVWLRPHLGIVDGTITLEEILRRQIGSELVMDRQISVDKYSPTVALGSFSLLGWSATDLEKAETVHYHGQNVRAVQDRVNSRHDRIFHAVGIALCVLIAVGVAAFITWSIRSDRQAKAVLATYMALHASDNQYTLKPGDLLTLPAGRMPLRFSRIQFWGSSERQLLFAKVSAAAAADSSGMILPPPEFVSFTVPKEGYGDINLAAPLGVPATLHLFTASDDSLVYAVTEYGETPEQP